MFFNVAKSLIYLKRSSLEFYRGADREELQFPPAVFQNIEILDAETFEKLITTFLSNLKVKKQKVIIVLSEELLFQKEIVTVDEEELKERSQNFLDSLPFASDKVAIKNVTDGQRKFIFATNKKIYSLLKAIIENLDCEVKAVVPMTLFKEKYTVENSELTTYLAKKIASDKNLLKRSNFLEDTPESELAEHFSKKKIFLIVGVILVFLVGIILVVIRFNLIKALNLTDQENKNENKVVTEVKDETKESSEAATPSESTESAQISQEEIKVQILNGTGITGQAARVKDILLGLGFKEVETGDAVGTGTGETAVVFSKKVSQSLRDEIVGELKKIFASINVREEAEEAEFDIIITTGQYSD